jgi:hypothetical protein
MTMSLTLHVHAQARAATASADQAQKRGKSKRMWDDLVDLASPSGTSLQLRKPGAGGGGKAHVDSGSGGDEDYDRACAASMQVRCSLFLSFFCSTLFLCLRVEL